MTRTAGHRGRATRREAAREVWAQSIGSGPASRPPATSAPTPALAHSISFARAHSPSAPHHGVPGDVGARYRGPSGAGLTGGACDQGSGDIGRVPVQQLVGSVV